MTNQEVFDIVVPALRRQRIRSVDDKGNCMYRGPSGLKCAAGHLIPDNEYYPSFEGCGIIPNSIVGQCLARRCIDLEFIRNLQFIHDEYGPEKWEERWQNLAMKKGLQMPAKEESI